LSAGRTEPEVFGIERDKAELGLAHHLAEKKFPDTIPRTDRVAGAALIAELCGLAASLFYAFDDFLKGSKGNNFHGRLPFS